MDYTFNNLNTSDFEDLIQALSQKLLGKSSLVYGSGADGARELTYQGKAPFPNNSNSWDGYWVIQAKYKSGTTNQDSFEWVKRNFTLEMNKFSDKKRKLQVPNNYLFFTNAKLSAVQDKGGRDKIEELKNKYKSLIPNIYIGTYDELCKFLDNNRDVATSYSSFLLSGDILMKLYNLLDYKQHKKNATQNQIITFLEKSFNSELYSKLIQAGDLINQINIQKVFIDIDVTRHQVPDSRIKFLEQLIKMGDKKATSTSPCKLVLVGSAGSGKSTLSQFASQIYAAYFIADNRGELINENVKNFINDYNILPKPKCLRFPVKIILKDYASWLKKQSIVNQSTTILNYLKGRIDLLGDANIDVDLLREFLSSVSSLIIFDGLDEVPITSNREEVLKEINDFVDIELRNLKSDCVILCTTRQQGYTKEFDIHSYQHFYVSELSDDDCEKYLVKLLDNIEISFDDKNSYLNILKEALKEDVTGRLMRTPLQATIMTILVKSGGKPSRNKYNLFKEYYDTIYKRELQKELLPILKDRKRNIDHIHSLLGFELQVKSEGDENPSALFESEEFTNLIRIYLKNQEEWSDDEISDFIIKIRHAVTERLVFIGEMQENKIGFVVRSLQEYFAATYLINFDDSKVFQNICGIASNSYWRNTFLFAVSGIHNNKNYLVDKIYLFCETLNGCEELPSSTSENQIQLYGSWLALEFLSEGIFSDSPKYKNRFVNLLEKLFTTVTTGDLSKIIYLPHETIHEVIIDKYIKSSLESDCKFHFKYASFKLCFSLLNLPQYQARIIELLEENWVESKSKLLLGMMCSSGLSNNSLFFHKFHLVIMGDDYLDYCQLIYDYLLKPKFISGILKFFKGDKLFISRLIELMFITTLNKPLTRNQDEVFKIFDNLLNKKVFETGIIGQDWGILTHDTYVEKLEVLDGYTVHLGLIKSHNVNLNNFIKLFKKYEIDYLIDYIVFLQNPTAFNLSIFLLTLKTRNNKALYHNIIRASRIWLFKKPLIEKTPFEEIGKLIESIQSGKLGDIEDWINEENEMINKVDFEKIFLCINLTSQAMDKKLLKRFFSKYKVQLVDKKNHILRGEFLKVFTNSFDEDLLLTRDDLNSQILLCLLDILNNSDRINISSWQKHILRSSIISFFYCADIKTIQKLDFKIFELYCFDDFNDHYRYSKQMNQSVIEKSVNYFNNCEYNGIDSGVEKLIVYLLSDANESAFAHLKNLKINYDIDNISIHLLLLKTLVSENEILISDEIFDFAEILDRCSSFYNVLIKSVLNLKLLDNKFKILFIQLFNLSIKNKNEDIQLITSIQHYLKLIQDNTITQMKNLQLK